MNNQYSIKKDNYLDRVTETSEKIESIQMSEDIENISIKSLSPYFSGYALNFFKKINIENFGQLCNIVNQPSTLIQLKKSIIETEIIGTTNLLRCKFLNEDPLIDITSKESICVRKGPLSRIRPNKEFSQIGFSTSATNILYFRYDTVNDLFTSFKKDNFEEILHGCRNCGDKIFNEIILKLGIVTEYYDNIKKANDNSEQERVEQIVSSEDLKELNAELKQLREQKNKIDAQIDFVLEKIQAKMLEQSKVGGHKR